MYKRQAGRHALSVVLKNYVLSNNTATLVIQARPVIFTVTDNVATVGGEPTINVQENLTEGKMCIRDRPTVTLRADQSEVTYGEDITLFAEANHAAGDDVSLTYQWYKDSDTTPIGGESESTLTRSAVADSGSYHVVVTATDHNGLTAETTSESVPVFIGMANPVTRWPTASDIIYGQSLNESLLTGGVAVPGAFSWDCLLYTS